jgi:hypothetical protein
MSGFFARLWGKRDRAAAEREVAQEQMSPEERAFTSERVEDHAADLAVESRLGGIDPDRLLEE